MITQIKPGSILFVAGALAAMLAAPALAGLYIPDAYMTPQPVSYSQISNIPTMQTESVPADESDAVALVLDGTEQPKSQDELSITVYNNEVGKVMTMGLEEYLAGVVSGEMPISFGVEALKAQAVAARSYSMYKIARGSQNSASHHGAQLCTDSTHCKAYVTHETLAEKWGAETADNIFAEVSAAISATRGEIITYQGEAALAVFHSSSDGYTEAASSVWGNYVPYLVSVETPENIDPQVTVFTRQQLADALASEGVSYEGTALPKIEYDDSGRVASVTFGDTVVAGTRIRELLGLRSTDFSLVILDGEYIITARGYGHGVGMSQYGAAAMAAGGSTYGEILAHYFPGTDLSFMYD